MKDKKNLLGYAPEALRQANEKPFYGSSKTCLDLPNCDYDSVP